MKHYTETISADLAKKLKEKGMPIEVQPRYVREALNTRGIVKAGVGLWCPTYAEVLDWFLDRDISIAITCMGKFKKDKSAYEAYMCWNEATEECTIAKGSWRAVTSAAIKKALTLI